MSSKPERKLSDAEEKRLAAYNAVAEELKAQGYIEKDLTLSETKANLVGSLYGLLLGLPFVIVYNIVNRETFNHFFDNFLEFNLLLYLVALILGIVIHECLHGLTWSLFAKSGFKSIEFGVIWQSLNPYCTCKEPLNKTQYILGSFMPCLVLGIIPSIIGIVTANGWLFVLGFIMITAAGGDLLIIKELLQTNLKEDALIQDHPTKIGLVVFEK